MKKCKKVFISNEGKQYIIFKVHIYSEDWALAAFFFTMSQGFKAVACRVVNVANK